MKLLFLLLIVRVSLKIMTGNSLPIIRRLPLPDSILEDQLRVLKLENEALKNANQQLNDKCMKLEFDKQHAEKQCRILHKQMEKLTQVLDKLKGG